MRLTACVFTAVLMAALGSARADEPTTEQLVKDLLGKHKELTELFDAIKDKTAAEKAKPKVKALSDEMFKLMDALDKRPVDNEVKNKFAAEADKHRFELAFNRMTDRVPGSAEVFADVRIIRDIVQGNEVRAKVDAEVIIRGLQTYYTQHARWPARLADMANLFEKGVDAFKDPWGNEYKFEIGTKTLPDGTVVEMPYVWTERKVGDEVRVIGTRPVKKQ